MSQNIRASETESFYKMLLKIAFPITLQSLIQSALTIIDQMMVGQLGEQAISSIAIGNKFFIVYQYLVVAITGGVGIFIAQFWGKKEMSNIVKTLKLPIFMGGIVFVAFFLLVAIFPQQSIRVFSADPNVIEQGAVVQKIYLISALPVLLTNIYSTLLRSTCRVKVPMITGIISIVLNTMLNYILIFGKFGLEPMGVYGAACATVVARVVETVILIAVVHIKSDVRFNILDVFRNKLDVTFIKRCLKSIWPLFILNVVFVSSDTIYSSLYGNMGTDEMASISIMVPLQGFSIGLFNGISSATSIILGVKLGGKEIDVAKKYAARILKISTILTLIIAVILAVSSNWYLSIYNINDVVFEISHNLVLVAALFLCVRVLNMVIGQGIIQSGGNTRYILFLDIIGMWCIGVPIAFISVMLFHFPIYWVYFMISLEEVVRLILGLRKVKKGDWAKNLVEDISM